MAGKPVGKTTWSFQPITDSQFPKSYPGCKCDIPAHNYAYSFAPNAEWPNYYATSQQIHQYMHAVAKKYDCNKYIKYQHAIKSAVWKEARGKWNIKVEKAGGSVIEDEVDVFINAGGVLK